MPLRSALFPFFFFNDTATTEIYTLSLHDALPISSPFFDRQQAPRDVNTTPTFPGCSRLDRKSTRLNSSHVRISYAVFCLKKKKTPSVDRAHFIIDTRWYEVLVFNATATDGITIVS